MAGIGRNPRHGKRPSSSSSSSYFSTVTMVVFIAFCILGLWMLTSSSIVPSHRRSRIATISSSANRPLSRISRVNPLPAEDDDEIEDKPKPDLKPDSSVSSTGEGETAQLESESGIGDSTQIEESGTQQERSTGGDERQDLEQQSQGEETQLQSEQQEIATKISEEQPNPEQEIDNQEEAQQQNQQEKEQEAENQEEKQEQIGATDDSNQQESQQQEAENQGETQQQIGGTDEENQQETTQQQETGASGEETQQEIQEVKQQETEQESQAETQETQQQNSEETQSQPETQTYSEGDDKENSQQESTTETSEESQKHDEEELVEPNATISDGTEGKKSSWATQADQSENEKERRKGDEPQSDEGGDVGNLFGHEWELCNVTAGPDYIPCLDNEKAIKKLHIKHYEHRERHCPEESPTCLVPLPNGYKRSIEWPKSRERIWYNNVPRTKLAEVKGHQNWVKISGQYLTFPGGGTQFIHGALHYIDFIQQSVHDITWGKRTRVILDVGCGVASFGGYLFERDVLAMSFAPKDEHEAQVQFALERGIPAISAVMGSQRLPFPSRVFDLVHCARCRVPWHADGGTLLLELNRVLRPGGYFVWSATPVYQKLKEDVEIWNAMKSLTISMCWDLITIKRDKLNSVGAAFFRKPISNECYDNRKHHSPPMCQQDDDPNAAWYIPMKTCMHRVPVDASERGSQWPDTWPRRLQVPPYWLNSSQAGIYGKPAPDDFTSDYEHWKRIIAKSYLSGLGIDWSRVRNVMDMRAVYGGFAAALKDIKVWVLNVVNVDSPDTLPIIYERGLFGIYHDWCESFSTYPRTYDLLHADRLFSQVKKRCEIVPLMVEIDRIMRPGGKLIVRDESSIVSEVESMLKSLHWEVRFTFSKDQEGLLCAEKSEWRPEKLSGSS